jgi:hypothetical protein
VLFRQVRPPTKIGVERPAHQQQEREQAALKRLSAFDPHWHLEQAQASQAEGNAFAAAIARRLVCDPGGAYGPSGQVRGCGPGLQGQRR